MTLVPAVGVEPTRPFGALDFESSPSAGSGTLASKNSILQSATFSRVERDVDIVSNRLRRLPGCGIDGILQKRERVYSRHGETERDGAETLKDLVTARWRDDVGWMRSTRLGCSVRRSRCRERVSPPWTLR